MDLPLTKSQLIVTTVAVQDSVKQLEKKKAKLDQQLADAREILDLYTQLLSKVLDDRRRGGVVTGG